MKKYLLYGHGGAYNHGAEAILRSTIAQLRKHDPGTPIVVSTHFPEQDREFGLDQLADRLIPADLSLVPSERAQESWAGKEEVASHIYRDALAEIDADTICLAVGGDNYCYHNWYRQSIFHKTAKARGAQSILWGCSIQPEAIDDRMEAILRDHDHIYVRESMTQKALLELGITQVTLERDPAFGLQPQPIVLPELFVPGKTAALNVSPLMLRQGEGLLAYFVETAQVLLRHVDALLLVSHVMMPMDNDYDALTALAEQLSEDQRRKLCLTSPKWNAEQLKYAISQCEVLVCCRTHASIAGYSTGVPTLVAGYSVKSQGIAVDLGMEAWMLPAHQLAQLPRCAERLWYDREKIHQMLERGEV